MRSKIVGCVISALVSSQGVSINTNHLRTLEPIPSGGCIIRQYYNPHTIYSDWSCEQVEDSIVYAIEHGCEEVS